MNKRLDPSREAWMHASETRAVMDALSWEGGVARFVGGAVRNALLGLRVDDIDIATPLLPDDVIRRLERARIRAVPTGIEHGTVTAVLGGKAFEITTLRHDVETDGRHARVAFSDDWEEDAGRRDFTVNALYASPDGQVFDYFEGIVDLEARHIRFIGDPSQRIREDYLRILRLFRFHAWYGRGAMDEAALDAAKAARAGLLRLSGERIQKEVLRLLEAKNPSNVLHIMAEAGILKEIIPGEPRLACLEHLVAIQDANVLEADPLLRLCAVAPRDNHVATALSHRLKLSSASRDRIVALASPGARTPPHLSERELRQMLFHLGTLNMRDRILLSWAEDSDESHNAAWRHLLGEATDWIRPVFPLSGRDVLAAGIEPGPRVGEILSQIETAWIDNDFAEDRLSLLNRLDAIAKTAPH